MVNIATPSVTPIAHTSLTRINDDKGPDFWIDRYMVSDLEATAAEELSEFAGRGCYESYSKPNPATEKNRDYIRNIIDQGHESVLEHGSVSFYLSGVSRALTHELVRHRHFSFSQLSQRFVNEDEAAMVIPPALEGNGPAIATLGYTFNEALESYKELVQTLQDQGLPRKQAREAARAVLPNCTETKLVISGNHRAWREFLKKRLDPAADAEIRRLAEMIRDHLKEVAPSMYEEF